MFNMPILDIALTLAFTYLLLAIIASSINEWLLNSVLKSRSKDLKTTIENLLFDSQWKVIAANILSSPFISSLKKSSEKFPSYIPAKNFASAFMGVIKEGAELTEVTDNFNVPALKRLLNENKLITGDALKVLNGILDRSGGSIDKFHENLELFFNDAMNRASGWYKRKAKRVAFIIALIISFSLNVDTIQITKALWEQPQLANAAANLATQHLADIDTSGGNYGVKGFKITSTDTTIKKNSRAGDTTITISKKSIKNIQDAQSILDELHLPIGWASGNYPGNENGRFDYLGWISKLIGLLLTTGSVSLGAPFWFDLANKFINIRTSGASPDQENKNRNHDKK